MEIKSVYINVETKELYLNGEKYEKEIVIGVPMSTELLDWTHRVLINPTPKEKRVPQKIPSLEARFFPKRAAFGATGCNVNTWIKCSDRLPPFDTDVLTLVEYRDGTREPDISQLDSKDGTTWWLHMDCCGASLSEEWSKETNTRVIAWMEIPKYEEE